MSRLAAIKLEARRALHNALSVSAQYSDQFVLLPIPVTVRWHMKQGLVGELDAGGYAEFIQSVERLVFNMEELTTKGVDLARGGKVELTDPEYALPGGGVPTFTLDAQEDDTGPLERIWKVTRP